MKGHVPRVRHPAVGFTLCALILALAACAETPRPTPAPVTIRLSASSTLSALIDDLSDLYRFDRDWVSVQQEAVNTAAAIDLLNDGAVDLAFVSWLPAGLDARLWQSALAHDAVAVVVHPSNPTTAVSLAQLRDIYAGRVADWSPFGWGGQGLVVVSREDGSGTRAAFENAVMEGHAVTLSAIVQPDSESMVAYVARTPGAIGYVSRGRVTPAVKPIAVEGVEPLPLHAANGAYPIGRVLTVLARREPEGGARDFVVWLLSEEGQQAVAERGFGRVK